jgi:hypothetical protein
VDGRSNVFGGYVQVDGFWELEKREEEEEEEEERRKRRKEGAGRPNFVARIYQISTLPLYAVCAFSGLDNDGLKNYHVDSRPLPQKRTVSEWINPLFTWTRLLRGAIPVGLTPTHPRTLSCLP